MDTKAVIPDSKPSLPYPNLSDEVNRNAVQSEIEGGVCLDDLSEGVRLEVETQHRWYVAYPFGCQSGGPMLNFRHRPPWFSDDAPRISAGIPR